LKEFNPIEAVEDCHLILDNDQWPNFHDAEVHRLNIWRGDVRPDEKVWIGTTIEASFELCALKCPYMVTIKFHDCESISMHEFNHQNAVYDLKFSYEERGTYNNGNPLPPYISVTFEQAFGIELSFKCFRVQALERKIIGHS
jgi:hypothetical protein